MVSRGVFIRDDCSTADQKGMTGLVHIGIEARWLRRMRFSMLYPILLGHGTNPVHGVSQEYFQGRVSSCRKRECH